MRSNRKFRSVKGATVAANIPGRGGLDSEPSQLSHGGDKGSVKVTGVLGPVVDDALRLRVLPKVLVGSEETLSLLEVLEVHVVESPRGVRVHVDRDPRVNVDRAHTLELLGVCLVQRGVNASLLDPAGNVVAVREPDCVRACEI